MLAKQLAPDSEFDIPQHHNTVLSARERAPSVRRNGDPRNPGLMSAEKPYRSILVEAPVADVAIVSAGDQVLARGRGCHRRYCGCVAARRRCRKRAAGNLQPTSSAADGIFEQR